MKKYLENLIGSAGKVIVGVDTNRNICVWNSEAEKIFGYKASEVIGRDVSAIIPRDWREQRSDLVKKVVSGEVVKNLSMKRYVEGGSIVDASLTLSPIKDEKGKVIGISAISD